MERPCLEPSEARVPPTVLACWLCGNLIDSGPLSAARGGEKWHESLTLEREGQVWIRTAVDRSMGDPGQSARVCAAMALTRRRAYSPPSTFLPAPRPPRWAIASSKLRMDVGGLFVSGRQRPWQNLRNRFWA